MNTVLNYRTQLLHEINGHFQYEKDAVVKCFLTSFRCKKNITTDLDSLVLNTLDLLLISD